MYHYPFSQFSLLITECCMYCHCTQVLHQRPFQGGLAPELQLILLLQPLGTGTQKLQRELGGEHPDRLRSLTSILVTVDITTCSTEIHQNVLALHTDFLEGRLRKGRGKGEGLKTLFEINKPPTSFYVFFLFCNSRDFPSKCSFKSVMVYFISYVYHYGFDI